MVGNRTKVLEYKLFQTRELDIGAARAPNRVILAPMSGITDAPFRRLAEELGAGLVVSEMTACAGLVRGEREATVRSDGRGVDIHVVHMDRKIHADFIRTGRAKLDAIAGARHPK